MSKCDCKSFPHDDWCSDHPHQEMRLKIEELEDALRQAADEIERLKSICGIIHLPLYQIANAHEFAVAHGWRWVINP